MPGGVASLEEFWEMLTNSKDGYKAFPKDRFNWEAYYHPNQARKDSIHVHNGYFLDGNVTDFDAGFFKMNAIDATSFVRCLGASFYPFMSSFLIQDENANTS